MNNKYPDRIPPKTAPRDFVNELGLLKSEVGKDSEVNIQEKPYPDIEIRGRSYEAVTEHEVESTKDIIVLYWLKEGSKDYNRLRSRPEFFVSSAF